MKYFQDDSVMGLFDYLFGWKKWGIRKGGLVLELGSGGSPMVRSNILLDRYIYDDSERELNITKDRPLVCADIANLPFREGIFDFIYASHVLEHLDELEKGLSEMVRVGKRGLIIVPGEIFERAWDKYSHRWIITVVGDHLIFREKCTCTYLIENDVLEEWKHIFWKVYIKNRDLLDIHFFWEDTIPFKIIKCANGGFGKNIPAIKKGDIKRDINLKYRIKVKVQVFLSRIIRSLYG